jgi:uncharacterized membrane protein
MTISMPFESASPSRVEGDPWRAGPAQDRRELVNLTRALGAFSLALGAVALAEPRKLGRLIGLDDQPTQVILRAAGLRELVSGVGLLAQPTASTWIWARLGGDIVDLAALGTAWLADKGDRRRLADASVLVAGVTALDAFCVTRASSLPMTAQPRALEGDVEMTAAITINAPAADVYRAWDGFQALPGFMRDFATVAPLGNGRSRWNIALPAEKSIAWEIEITESRANELIAWRSGASSPLNAEGTVRFREAPRDQGTELIFAARIAPPGGELGRMIGARVADVWGTKMSSDLRRCKQLIELGEIVQSDDSVVPGPNPAQPTRQHTA